MTSSKTHTNEAGGFDIVEVRVRRSGDLARSMWQLPVVTSNYWNLLPRSGQTGKL